jgi:D-alanyl-D-alanine carboxypeptidase
MKHARAAPGGRTFALCSFVFGLSLAASSCFADTSVASGRTFVAPSSIPAELVSKINASKAEFIAELESVLREDDLLFFVDKKHSLPTGFVPDDLVPLTEGRSYTISRKDLSLRVPAESALEEMARAARKDGITLVASSSYRSYDYQKKVYARIVGELGQAAADRESARPGTSQHQLGTAVDFGSITDDFAKTKAGMWLAAHAADYGWSLSFPEGYESVTGYRWECWHYRFVGKKAAALQKKWFGGIQQYMIEFIDAWKKAGLAAH